MHLDSILLFAVVRSVSHVWHFVTPWPTAHQVSLSFSISLSLLRLMSIELKMPSSHLILCINIQIFVFLFLTYFTLYERLYVHPQLYWWPNFFPFHGWVIFHWMAITKKIYKWYMLERHGEKGILLFCWWECKWIQSLGKVPSEPGMSTSALLSLFGGGGCPVHCGVFDSIPAP